VEIPSEPAPVVMKLEFPKETPPESWSCTLLGVPPVVPKVKVAAPVPNALLVVAMMRPELAAEPVAFSVTAPEKPLPEPFKVKVPLPVFVSVPEPESVPLNVVLPEVEITKGPVLNTKLPFAVTTAAPEIASPPDPVVIVVAPTVAPKRVVPVPEITMPPPPPLAVTFAFK